MSFVTRPLSKEGDICLWTFWIHKVLSSLRVMDEPLFIKCEPNWPSGAEEPSNELNKQLTAENTVEVKVEPDCVLGRTDQEGEREFSKEEHKFQELTEKLTAENSVEVKTEPDYVRGWTDEEGETEIFKEEHEYEEEASSDVGVARETPANKSEKDYQSNSAEGKKYKCDVCLERFSDRNHLTTHERTHTFIKPFKCDVCGSVVSTAKSLRLHLMGHTGNYKCKCDICGRGFGNEKSLARHNLTHTGNYEFECEICKKKFSQKSSMQQHMLVHKPDREFPKYECHLCSFYAHRRASVLTHLIKRHVPSTSNML